MRLVEVRAQNYRTISALSIKFPNYYTAICGKNDAGKSNLIRVLRSSFQRHGPVIFVGLSPEVSVKDDFIKWREKETPLAQRIITFDYILEIDREDDEGLHSFLVTYLALEGAIADGEKLSVTLSVRRTGDDKSAHIGLSIAGTVYEDLKSQEVYKRLRSSSIMLFHDSTEFFHPFQSRQSANFFREMSTADEEKVKEAQANVNKVLTKITKKTQQDLTEMLGRLREKYKIGLSLANNDIEDIPYTVTLGTDDGDVELDDWGSGTQNRTRILMTLFKAKKVREADTSSEKVTPVIVIEEPESYLHPSAQAEFGRTLRDLASEFKIQVIVTTHSPYLLSLDRCDANVLLERKSVRKRDRETEVINTSGDRWMEPFGLALGISDFELAPWREVLFAGTSSVLLVEGETDKEYLTLLQDPIHGENRLRFEGTIFPYDGKDSLKQKQLLKFVMSQFKRFLITFDLDCENELEQTLKSLGLAKGRDYVAIGKDVAGKKAMEGLLPDPVLKKVFADNVDLVQKATAATGSEAKSAKSLLKKLYLEEFKLIKAGGHDDYKNFYALTKQLNKMLSDGTKSSPNLRDG